MLGGQDIRAGWTASRSLGNPAPDNACSCVCQLIDVSVLVVFSCKPHASNKASTSFLSYDYISACDCHVT